MNFKMILVVALGGAIGSVARYLMMSGVGHFWKSSFPLSTLLVNVLGSLVIGMLTEFMVQHGHFSLPMRTFLIAGILGGFTTFSTFSLDAGFLIQKGAWFLTSLYVVGSVGISLLAFFGGMAIFR